MASMKAQKVHEKKGKRKMRRVTVERVGNGYQVSHHPEPTMKRSPGGMMMPNHMEEPPKDMVFSGKGAHKQMLAHVGQQMAPDEEAGEAPPMNAPAMPGQAA